MNDPNPRVLDRALIQRASAGDAHAERALIQALTPIIRASVGRTIRRCTGRAGAADVDDVTQSVLLSLFACSGGAMARWDPDRGLGLSGFVSLVASHETVSILRGRRRRAWAEVPTQREALDQSPAVAVEPEAAASARRMVAAVVERVRGRVSARGGQLFDLLFLEQHSPEDIAALTGLGLPAIYTWSSRLSRLGREVAAELESDVPAANRGERRTPLPLSASRLPRRERGRSPDPWPRSDAST